MACVCVTSRNCEYLPGLPSARAISENEASMGVERIDCCDDALLLVKLQVLSERWVQTAYVDMRCDLRPCRDEVRPELPDLSLESSFSARIILSS